MMGCSETRGALLHRSPTLHAMGGPVPTLSGIEVIMKHTLSVAAAGTALLLFSACGAQPISSPDAGGTVPQASATLTEETTTPTTLPQTTSAPVATQEPAAFPLSEPGPYHVGMRTLVSEDSSRAGRRVSITVWYPALPPASEGSADPTRDAEPDPSAAPYPLLISSTKVASIFAPILVSHGFSWASVDGLDTYYRMNEEMYQQPLDILFALHQVAATPPEGLEGIIDSEHAGAIGYSFDGYNTLAISGARIDPAYYLAQCPDPDPITAPILSPLSSFNCTPAENWEEFVAAAGDTLKTAEDGLLQPMTDERIRAVMPMAGEGWWLFGEAGLAAVDKPTLILAAAQDDLYPENVLIYAHLGTPDKVFITFLGLDHMMIFAKQPIARMAHFAVAFFGYHLQGRQDLAYYFSEEFVAQHTDLAWGVYAEQ
jgi:predicted dienelactone hydrolase